MAKAQKQTIIALDQLVNTLIPGGWADETISARAYRNSSNGHRGWYRAMRVIDGIFFWQPGHCKESHKAEQVRMHLPPAYRTADSKGDNNGA